MLNNSKPAITGIFYVGCFIFFNIGEINLLELTFIGIDGRPNKGLIELALARRTIPSAHELQIDHRRNRICTCVLQAMGNLYNISRRIDRVGLGKLYPSRLRHQR